MKMNGTKRYPTALKESVARRYLSRKTTFKALADEIGAEKSTVRGWVVQYQKEGSVGRKKGRRDANEKLRLLLEAKSLEDSDLGAFLRREGLHESDLATWEKEALGGLSRKADAAQEARIKELEQRQAKQDRRLREAEALLELQKKVHALWGDEDDDTNGSFE